MNLGNNYKYSHILPLTSQVIPDQHQDTTDHVRIFGVLENVGSLLPILCSSKLPINEGILDLMVYMYKKVKILYIWYEMYMKCTWNIHEMYIQSYIGYGAFQKVEFDNLTFLL